MSQQLGVGGGEQGERGGAKLFTYLAVQGVLVSVSCLSIRIVFIYFSFCLQGEGSFVL